MHFSNKVCFINIVRQLLPIAASSCICERKVRLQILYSSLHREGQEMAHFGLCPLDDLGFTILDLRN